MTKFVGMIIILFGFSLFAVASGNQNDPPTKDGEAAYMQADSNAHCVPGQSVQYKNGDVTISACPKGVIQPDRNDKTNPSENTSTTVNPAEADTGAAPASKNVK